MVDDVYKVFHEHIGRHVLSPNVSESDFNFSPISFPETVVLQAAVLNGRRWNTGGFAITSKDRVFIFGKVTFGHTPSVGTIRHTFSKKVIQDELGVDAKTASIIQDSFADRMKNDKTPIDKRVKKNKKFYNRVMSFLVSVLYRPAWTYIDQKNQFWKFVFRQEIADDADNKFSLDADEYIVLCHLFGQNNEGVERMRISTPYKTYVAHPYGVQTTVTIADLAELLSNPKVTDEINWYLRKDYPIPEELYDDWRRLGPLLRHDYIYDGVGKEPRGAKFS